VQAGQHREAEDDVGEEIGRVLAGRKKGAPWSVCFPIVCRAMDGRMGRSLTQVQSHGASR
jgi:hypothetical protein